MEEVLIRLDKTQWENMKRGFKSMVIRESVPMEIMLPFRAIVYVDEIGVVGKFDCDEWRITSSAESLVKGSCFTASQLIMRAAEKPLCGWHVKSASVYRYSTPLDLEYATGISEPPESWQYLHRDST